MKRILIGLIIFMVLLVIYFSANNPNALSTDIENYIGRIEEIDMSDESGTAIDYSTYQKNVIGTI